jgi:hypothetical protein
MSAPVVYGYVRVLVDNDVFVRECKDQIAVWCAREGWHLGAVFSDSGGPLSDDRIGFAGLVDALALPDAVAVVVLNPLHLSPRAEVTASLVESIRHTGCEVRVRDGELPEPARRLCLGRREQRPR